LTGGLKSSVIRANRCASDIQRLGSYLQRAVRADHGQAEPDLRGGEADADGGRDAGVEDEAAHQRVRRGQLRVRVRAVRPRLAGLACTCATLASDCQGCMVCCTNAGACLTATTSFQSAAGNELASELCLWQLALCSILLLFACRLSTAYAPPAAASMRRAARKWTDDSIMKPPGQCASLRRQLLSKYLFFAFIGMSHTCKAR